MRTRTSIESLCRNAGFCRCSFDTIDLRLENNAPIAGFIALAEKA
jgi:hypothetical protein